MTFDFTKIKAHRNEGATIDPVEIFQKNKGKVYDESINDLWLGQGDALREWNNHRDEEDIAIVLNTGAGKTLIGLLVAQSLVNETKGKVIYVCGSIQLIEQTREKAEGYGLPVTTYHSGEFSNDYFHRGMAACLTTYQALFNGKSIFADSQIDAVIFDDAHTAENMIKSHFSLELKRDIDRELYDGLTSLFRPYYKSVGKAGSFNELYDGSNRKVELLHPSVVQNNFSEILRLLSQSESIKFGGNIFSWEHLKDHLDLCSFLVSTGSIQITPAFIPVSSLPYFASGIRRVYLTATMLGEDAFLRTFGRELKHVVKPTTTAGECERLILMPGQNQGFDDGCDVDAAKEIISSKKALVLTPSAYQSSKWKDIGYIPKRSEVTNAIAEFKLDNESNKLVLAGRYDGIDLPGDTCRYMVLDGLPCGTSLFDRYLWSSLNLANTLRSIIACRVVQSLGRISRGMSDYGVVLVTDKAYVNWLLTPKNLSALPEFVQKQILLGVKVGEEAESIADMISASETFMSRNTGWLTFYEDFMNDSEVEAAGSDGATLRKLANAEIRFSKFFWERTFDKAALSLNNVLEEAFEFSAGLGAWYSLWVGYCLELLGDVSYSNLYKRAYSASRSIPKALLPNQDFTDFPHSAQVSNMVNEFEYSSGSSVLVPKNMLNNLSALDGNGSVNQIEEAIRYLGQYLGLDSTRPDKEFSIGPDNLWVLGSSAIAIEAKTSKTDDVKYSKDYVGQLGQHIIWVNEHVEVESIIPAFIGPVIAATDSASPSDDMQVASLESLNSLSTKLISACDDIAASALPITLPQQIEEVFKERGLLWPDVLEQLNLTCLKEL